MIRKPNERSTSKSLLNMIKNINLFILDPSEKKTVEPLMIRSKTQANIKKSNDEEQVFKNNKREEQDSEIEIKPMPFDISKIENSQIYGKKCHICSREYVYYYLWKHCYCMSCWKYLACKNCDNHMNKSRAYKGINNEVFCEACISKNKKRIIYKTKNKINIKLMAFNINGIECSRAYLENCRICRDENVYYDLWTHYYCLFCWNYLACKGCDNFLDKKKAYRGKNNDVYCEECIWYYCKSSLPSKNCKIL